MLTDLDIRICPGAYIAKATLWLTAAGLLSLYDIETDEKPEFFDSDGKISEKFDPGFIWCVNSTTVVQVALGTVYSPLAHSYPRPFECRFKVRLPEAAALLNEMEAGD